MKHFFILVALLLQFCFRVEALLQLGFTLICNKVTINIYIYKVNKKVSKNDGPSSNF